MSDKVLKYIFRGDSAGIEGAAQKSGRAITALGTKTLDVFGRMNRAALAVGDKVLNPFTTIASGAGIAMAGKQVMDFDGTLARMAIQARISKTETMLLKKELLDLAIKTKQRPEGLLEGMAEIVEKTGDIKLARNTLRDMGITAKATGAAVGEIGATTSQFSQKLQIAAKDMLSAFDIVNEQGKAGAFTMKEMSRLGERIFTAAGSIGVQGVEGLRKFGAFVQVARQGTGSSEMAATAVERTVADLIKKADTIKDITGFEIWDPVKSKQAGRSVMKDIDIVLKEIIKRTNGDVAKLEEIFGEESIRAMNAMAIGFNKTGDFREFNSFMKVGGDGTQMMQDFARYSEEPVQVFDDLLTRLNIFAKVNLAYPITLLTEALEGLSKHPAVLKGGIWALILGGAGIGALGGIALIKQIMGILRGGGASGKLGAGGGFGANPMAIYKVYVMNSKMSMMPDWKGAGGADGVPGASRTITGKARDLLNAGASKLPGVGGALAGGATAGGALATGAYAASALGIGYVIGTGINQGLGKLTGFEGKGSAWYEGGIGGALGEWLETHVIDPQYWRNRDVGQPLNPPAPPEVHVKVDVHNKMPDGRTIPPAPGSTYSETKKTVNQGPQG